MDMGLSGLLAAGKYQMLDTLGNVLMLIGGLMMIGGGLYAIVKGGEMTWRSEPVEPGKARMYGAVAALLGAVVMVYAILQMKG